MFQAKQSVVQSVRIWLLHRQLQLKLSNIYSNEVGVNGKIISMDGKVWKFKKN